MADQKNILLQDDNDATVTLYPVLGEFQGRGLIWRSNIAGVPVDGQVRLTVTQTPLAKGGFKVTEKLEVPKMETLLESSASGYPAAPKVAYVDTRITSTFSTNRTTTADLADLTRMGLHASLGASDVADTGLNVLTGAADVVLGVAATSPVPYAVVNNLGPT